jgi:hypothetical protein
METQNRNMGGNLSYRNSKTGSKKSGPQVKSLRAVGGLPGPSAPKPLKGFNSLSPQPVMKADRSSESHSRHSKARSEHYHAKIVGQNPKRTQELNPTKTIKAVRSFPGLANGE